ncbi:MAG: MscL family protein [Gemmatimonadaceae bacterium]|nr:MscL family protein [Gemmatimonadaceae bacterium]
MWDDFKAFLLKANVVGLALAVIVGGAAGGLVTAMTNDFIMPIVGAALPEGNWRTWTLDVGSIKFGVGDFAGAFLNFAIISFIAWQIGKIFVKPDPPAPPAPPTKSCPFCVSSIPAAATRCGFCTSQL